MAEYKLELKGVCKSFPGVKALDNVQLSLRPGTVHALMGENGAGKSTLMKCLFGIYRMDAGEVILDGKKIEINNPDEAMKYGIAMVHQELQPVPARSVAENLYLGRFPTKGFGPFKMIDHKTMYAETERWLKEVKMDFDPKAQLGSLSIGQMQSVEIAKAVSQQAKVVIFDEPTSSLSDNEVEALFRIMNDLRDKGVAMVYISHKMDEIKRIADDITIMRDGTYVGTWPAAELTTDQIIAKMVGRELTNVYPPKENKPGEVIMEVKDLCSIHEKSFQHVSFRIEKRRDPWIWWTGRCTENRVDGRYFRYPWCCIRRDLYARQENQDQTSYRCNECRYRTYYRGSSWKWYFRMPFHQRQCRCLCIQ